MALYAIKEKCLAGIKIEDEAIKGLRFANDIVSDIVVVSDR